MVCIQELAKQDQTNKEGNLLLYQHNNPERA